MLRVQTNLKGLLPEILSQGANAHSLQLCSEYPLLQFVVVRLLRQSVAELPYVTTLHELM